MLQQYPNQHKINGYLFNSISIKREKYLDTKMTAFSLKYGRIVQAFHNLL